ncbi:phage major capsid protein [Deinococcus ruber]|uniref:Phage major capsid protein n=1 Tax=Deinococcus ruber TaxID=1848197 RepID=A0A918C8Q5_9DEIO|nr:hypothetical protein [Deinococcus ruber]GGR11422.1 hypothetical protein GCM10008957_25260 [Deinococcus ruber]
MTIKKLSQLEKGMYDDAAKKGLSLTQFLDELTRKGEIDGDLVKPEARNGRGERVDSFKQLLAAAGIRTKGEFAQTGDAFLSDPNNRVLFPEFVNRTYRDAETDALNALQISDVVAYRVGIDGSAYRTGVIAAGQEKDLEFGRVAQGAELPVYSIVLSEQAVNLYKYGGVLKMSYEAVRRATLPMVTRYVQKIARAQGRRRVKQALGVGMNGDGNLNPAPASAASSSTAFALVDLIRLQMDGINNGAQFNIITGDTAELSAVLALDVFVSPTATSRGADFRDTGEWPTILGMHPRLALVGSPLEGSKKLLGIETGQGLEEIYETGSQLTESDKLIDTQFERIAISENLGYSKPDVQAFRTIAHA